MMMYHPIKFDCKKDLQFSRYGRQLGILLLVKLKSSSETLKVHKHVENQSLGEYRAIIEMAAATCYAWSSALCCFGAVERRRRQKERAASQSSST